MQSISKKLSPVKKIEEFSFKKKFYCNQQKMVKMFRVKSLGKKGRVVNENSVVLYALLEM